MSNQAAGELEDPITQENPLESTSPDQGIVHVQVLRITSDDTFHNTVVRSTTDGISLSTGDITLGHVPDVRKYWQSRSSLDQRRCIRVDVPAQWGNDKDFPLSPEFAGRYYVMICKLKKLGLHDLSPIGKTDADNGMGVYGDAFIFKVVMGEVDSNGRAVFDWVGADLVATGLARRMIISIAKGWDVGIVPREWLFMKGQGEKYWSSNDSTKSYDS